MYLYIMSRPHSGSTILDILLGGSARITGCGEVVLGLRRHGDGVYACSCGQLLDACPFWREVRGRIGDGDPGAWDELAAASIAQSHKLQLPATWLASAAPARLPLRLGRLAALTRRLSAAIQAASGRPIVLDSTKMP